MTTQKEAEAPNPLEFRINEATTINGYVIADITYQIVVILKAEKVFFFDKVK